VAVLTATIARIASTVPDYPGKRTIATTNLWKKIMNKNYCADLRVDSMYASTSFHFKKSLCPILKGLGKSVSSIHLYIVRLVTPILLATSSGLKNSFSVLLVIFMNTNNFLADYKNINEKSIIYMKMILYEKK
jgi:hypothetical protein